MANIASKLAYRLVLVGVGIPVGIATRKTLWTENAIESLRAAGVDTQKQPDAMVESTHPADRSIMFDAIRI